LEVPDFFNRKNKMIYYFANPASLCNPHKNKEMHFAVGQDGILSCKILQKN